MNENFDDDQRSTLFTNKKKTGVQMIIDESMNDEN